MDTGIMDQVEERGDSFTEEQLRTIAIKSARRIGYQTLKNS